MRITERAERGVWIATAGAWIAVAPLLIGYALQANADTGVKVPGTQTLRFEEPPVDLLPPLVIEREEETWPTTTTTTAPPAANVSAAPSPGSVASSIPPAPAPTTTTTTAPPPAPSLPSVLDVAQTMVGTLATDYNVGGDFWCAAFASAVLNAAGYDIHNDSPGQLRQLLAPTDEPAPGVFVFITFNPGTGQTDHVGVVESVNADGTLVTIEGNGYSRDVVARGVRQPSEVVGYGTVDGLPRQSEPVPYEPFEDPICAVKPWVCE